jgi:benzylsuccinate CoA-transferase BbsE subunit
VTLTMLAGIRVLDLGGEALARAGRVLVDLGADVVLVEPPTGSPARRVPPLVRTASGEDVSPHFLYTAAGKRSVTLDVDRGPGYDLFCRLLGTADIVLVTDDPATARRRRLGYETLRSLNDQLIVTSLTPFGTSGPRRHWRGSDLVAWASSGALVGIGDPDRRPVAPGGGLAFVAGSLNAVAGTVLALRARRRLGHGQLVDISLQEAVLSVTMESGPFFPLEGGMPRRVGPRRSAAQGLFPTSDGLVELLPFMPGQWDALAEWISEDLGLEEARMDTFRGSVLVRVPFAALIDGWVEQLAARYTKQGFLIEAQRRGIPCGAVNEPADLLDDLHLAAVNGWVDGDHPSTGPLRWPRPPLRVDNTPMGTGAVPAAGQHNQAIFAEELQVADEELRSLRVEGVI